MVLDLILWYPPSQETQQTTATPILGTWRAHDEEEGGGFGDESLSAASETQRTIIGSEASANLIHFSTPASLHTPGSSSASMQEQPSTLTLGLDPFVSSLETNLSTMLVATAAEDCGGDQFLTDDEAAAGTAAAGRAAVGTAATATAALGLSLHSAAKNSYRHRDDKSLLFADIKFNQ